MNSFRFPSVSAPDKYGFIVENETTWERGRGVCRWAKFYDTYGDGNVQHSKEVPFAIEMLEDFLGSLAMALAGANDADRAEMLALVEKNWPLQQNSKEKIEFALSLKCKEKTFYYSLDELKTSSSESKRHDRRWEKVSPYDSHVNGEVTSAAVILRTGDCYDTLHSLAAFLEILAIAERSTLNVFEHFGMGKDFRSLNMAECAWRAVADYVAAYRSMKSAARCAESWAHNVQNAKQKTAVA